MIGILKHAAKWQELDSKKVKSKKLRAARYPQLEEVLFIWFQQACASNAELSEFHLLGKAQALVSRIAEVLDGTKLTASWLQRFKKRHGISSYVRHGQSADVDLAGVERAVSELPAIINEYEPKDVFNFNETGLYYRTWPTRTLALGRVRGRKKQNDRITLGLAVNVLGAEKLKPVFIGKCARPRCFGKVWSLESIVQYEHNSTAWMNSTIFTMWLKAINSQFAAESRTVWSLIGALRR
jgi:hypothetical protein